MLGRQLELVVYDDASDPATAVRLYENLIPQDKVDRGWQACGFRSVGKKNPNYWDEGTYDSSVPQAPRRRADVVGDTLDRHALRSD